MTTKIFIKKWAEAVEFEDLCIIGGEPTLNLDMWNWVEGVRGLWPNSAITITSNGTRIVKYWGEEEYNKLKNIKRKLK